MASLIKKVLKPFEEEFLQLKEGPTGLKGHIGITRWGYSMGTIATQVDSFHEVLFVIDRTRLKALSCPFVSCGGQKHRCPEESNVTNVITFNGHKMAGVRFESR